MQQPWLLLLGVMSGPEDTEQPSFGFSLQAGREASSKQLTAGHRV